jgi:hypothetical protein
LLSTTPRWTPRGAYLYVRESALAYALDHVQLFSAEHDVLIVVLVMDRSEGLARVVACQQGIQPILLLLACYLVGIMVIPDVILILIPFQRHSTHCKAPQGSG